MIFFEFCSRVELEGTEKAQEVGCIVSHSRHWSMTHIVDGLQVKVAPERSRAEASSIDL